MKTTKFSEEPSLTSWGKSRQANPLSRQTANTGRPSIAGKKNYGGKGVAELRRLCQLEEENTKPSSWWLIYLWTSICFKR